MVIIFGNFLFTSYVLVQNNYIIAIIRQTRRLELADSETSARWDIGLCLTFCPPNLISYSLTQGALATNVWRKNTQKIHKRIPQHAELTSQLQPVECLLRLWVIGHME